MWQPSSVSSRSENRGQLAASSRGTLVTSAVTGDTKGAWVNIGAVTSFAYEGVLVCFSRLDRNADFMVDIGVSDGSNSYVLIPDLHVAGLKLGAESTLQLYIPVHIPAGAQISARCADSINNGQVDVSLIGFSSGFGGAPGFSRCVALFTPALSRGIAVDPGGTANTKGAWVQITASCPENIGAMFGLIGYNGDVARTAVNATLLLDIGIGAAASEFILYPDAYVAWGSVRDGPTNCPRIPLFAADVPSGTRIAARAACSLNTASDRTVDLALYGLVK